MERGRKGMAEGQGEDGPGSVGDSGATPIAVVVVVVVAGGGRRRTMERVGGRRRRRRGSGGGRGRDREKGRVDLQLRRESQAVTDRQTNLTALSFSSFSLLLRLHSRPASPMHRIAHTCTRSHTSPSLALSLRSLCSLFFSSSLSASQLPFRSLSRPISAFLRLPSLSLSLFLASSFLAFLSLRFLQHLPTRRLDIVTCPLFPRPPSSSPLRLP